MTGNYISCEHTVEARLMGDCKLSEFNSFCVSTDIAGGLTKWLTHRGIRFPNLSNGFTDNNAVTEQYTTRQTNVTIYATCAEYHKTSM